MNGRKKVVLGVVVIAAELLYFLAQLVSFHNLGDLPNLTPGTVGAMLSTAAMTALVVLTISTAKKRRRVFTHEHDTTGR